MRGEVMFWAGLSLLLIAAETLAPGVFMLWLGLAAAAVCVVVWSFPDLAPLWQAVTFIVLSFVSIAAYRRFFRKSDLQSDQPLLNRRAEQLVGKIFPLESAIVNGQGHIKIGDALWTVEGPELLAGTRVRVVDVDSMILKVLPTERGAL